MNRKNRFNLKENIQIIEKSQHQRKRPRPRPRPFVINIIVIGFRVFRYTINTILKAIEHAIELVLNKLRFSIAFKLTLAFILLFLLFFGILSASISGSYQAFVTDHADSGKNAYLPALNSLLGFFNMIGVILFAVVGSRITKKLLSPIDTMTTLARQISIDDLSSRLDVSGTKDELKDLSKTINEMLDRLEISVELQNQFVSDASHELRTPISVIQGYANLIDRWGKDDPKILEESISSIKGEAEWMKNLVEKLLFLARSDKNTQTLEKTKFMLDEVIEEVYRETCMIDKVHDIKCLQNDSVELYADKALLKEAIRIFIDNSIKYTGEGGTISIASMQEKSAVVIVIKDTGIGISKEDLPFIFNRFYRVDKSRTKASGGTGLGLGIAKWIIEHHNGKITAVSQLGSGTEIKLKLPLNSY